MDPITISLLIGSLASAGQGISSLFSKSPFKKAQGYFNQVPGALHQGYDPYIQAGQSAMPQLQQQYHQLLSDPNSMYSMLGQGFQKSPGYDFNMREAMNASNNAAAAGGIAGSPAHQRQAMGLAEQLSNQEFQNYLGHMFDLYGKGLSGIEGFNKMGYESSTGLADMLSQNFMNQGQMAFGGGSYNNMQTQSGLGNLLGGLGGLYGVKNYRS